MAMGNGYHFPAAQTGGSPTTPPQPDGEPTIVTVNLGLKWRHLAAGVAAIMGAVGSASAAGWLVLPAKQSDLTRVEQTLKTVETDLKDQREMTVKLVQAVDRLTDTVKLLQISTRPVQRKRPKAAR